MTIGPTLSLALLAGLSIPVGALISSNLVLRSVCIRFEVDSFVSYFGGGALLSAISLVLIPQGLEHASVLSASASFALGGLTFWQFSSWTARRGNKASQFLGMVLDFFPEGILLGAAAASDSRIVYLLSILIALQNLPEGFAAFQELRGGEKPRNRLWVIFLSAPLLGPVAAGIGFMCLSVSLGLLGFLLLFSSGGILYLIFEDIAPSANIKGKHFPAIGAVSGFMLGMIGTMMLH